MLFSVVTSSVASLIVVSTDPSTNIENPSQLAVGKKSGKMTLHSITAAVHAPYLSLSLSNHVLQSDSTVRGQRWSLIAPLSLQYRRSPGTLGSSAGFQWIPTSLYQQVK